jgi:hypothetical protein
MKDVLCVVTVVMAALGFAVFLSTVDALSAVPAPSKPAHYKMAASGAPGCRSEPEWLEREHRFRRKVAEPVNDKEHERGDP